MHTAGVVTDYLDKIGVKTLPQPPYSPDLSPPRLLPVPDIEETAQGTPLWWRRRHSRGRSQITKGHPRIGVPGGVRCMEISLATVHRCTRIVFRRVLRSCTDRINKWWFSDPVSLLIGHVFHEEFMLSIEHVPGNSVKVSSNVDFDFANPASNFETALLNRIFLASKRYKLHKLLSTNWY